MPVGSGPGPGTPPPTDAGVCAISPSDLVGFVGNALSRIKELEQRVAELEAANVEANQLSDISQQVGWVGGVEYMGMPGWTQTEYGSLIPPPGVSLSMLGIFPPTIAGGTPNQLVIYDNDGNLVFGADADGQLSGTMASSSNVALMYTQNPLLPATTTNDSETATYTEIFDPSGMVSFVSSEQFTLSTSGIYLLTLIASINAYNDPDNEAKGKVVWNISGNVTTYDPVNYPNGPAVFWQANNTPSNPADLSAALLMYVTSSAVHSLVATSSSSGGTVNIGGAGLGIQLIRAL